MKAYAYMFSSVFLFLDKYLLSTSKETHRATIPYFFYSLAYREKERV